MLAQLTLNQMIVLGNGYSRAFNNCQRFVRLLSSKLCAESVTDWLVTNLVFVSRAIPTSTLIKHAAWASFTGVGAVAMGKGILSSLAAEKGVVALSLLSVEGVFATVYGIFTTALIGAMYGPILVPAFNHTVMTRRKQKHHLLVGPEEYKKTFGNRSLQKEAFDSLWGSLFCGQKGREYAADWFQAERPEGLNVYRSVLSIASGHTATNSEDFARRALTTAQNVLRNEKVCAKLALKRGKNALKEAVFGVQNTNQNVSISSPRAKTRPSLRPTPSAKLSPNTKPCPNAKRSLNAEPTPRAKPVSCKTPSAKIVEQLDYNASNEQGNYGDVKDDTAELQGQVVTMLRISENGQRNEQEGEQVNVQMEDIGDAELLMEWLRHQEDQRVLV